LLEHAPETRRVSRIDGNIEVAPEIVQQQLNAALAWLQVNGAGASTPPITRASFNNSRL